VIEIEVLRGDITEVACDAIVNAANNHLWMGAGVAGAIKREGGAEIEAEAIAKGPIPVGEAVATSAGRLRARYVVHAAAMGQDLRTDAAKIQSATGAALRVADGLGLNTIAFPALGTGVGGFSVTDCARLMVDVVRVYRGVNLTKVVFVLLDQHAFEQFQSAAGTATEGIPNGL